MDIKKVPIANPGHLIFSRSPAPLKEAALTSLLTSDEKCFEYVLKIWDPIKKVINVELFSRLLNDLCFDAYICENVSSFNHEEFSHVSQIILCVWTTAPSELKMQYFQSSDYIDNLFLRFKNAIGMKIMDISWEPRVCYKHEVGFFLQLFSDMPLEMRPKVLRKYWLLFVARSRCETLICLISLCLINQDEIQTFIVTEMLNVTKIEKIVRSWSSRRLIYDVIDYSNLCSWDIDFVLKFRKRVFSIIISSLENFDRDKLWEVFALIQSRWIINEPQSLLGATCYKDYDVQKLLVEKLAEGLSEVVFWMIERFTPTKRSPCERQALLTHWHDFLAEQSDHQDYEARWREFLLWWECETNDCPLMKQFLSVDDVFQQLLLQVVPSLTRWLGPIEMDRAETVPSQNSKMEEFELVDGFLNWYFGTETAAKNYKWSQLLNFEEIPWLAKLLDANNECFVNDLLKWFFNGDSVEIAYFKDNVIKKIYVDLEIPFESYEPS